MAAIVAERAEERAFISGVSWETYERLLAEREPNPAVRIYYDDGELEIMTVHLRHEEINRLIEAIIHEVAVALRVPLRLIGSTTLKRFDLGKGAEPDSAYYVNRRRDAVGRENLDLTQEPAPDLVLEVDMTRSSMPKAKLYGGLGIGEWWRYDGNRLKIFVLRNGRYEDQPVSDILFPLTAEAVTGFLKSAGDLDFPEWTDSIRDWIRSAK